LTDRGPFSYRTQETLDAYAMATPVARSSAEEECAARRFVISPVQPGRIGGISLGLMAYPALKG
jgi:hypothetical protein